MSILYYLVGENGSLTEIALAKGATHTPRSVWKQLRARGVQVLPTIYNDANGYHTALLPRFMALAAAPVRPKTIPFCPCFFCPCMVLFTINFVWV